VTRALLKWVDGQHLQDGASPARSPQGGNGSPQLHAKRLPVLYGARDYRFPRPHNEGRVREWDFKGRHQHGPSNLVTSDSHADMKIKVERNDWIAHALRPEHQAQPGRDAGDSRGSGPVSAPAGQDADPRSPGGERPNGEQARFSSFLHEGHKYVMLRYQRT